MNEYQQALLRIIELEDKNAELLEALEGMLKLHYRLMEDYPYDKISFGLAQMIVRDRDKATEAIRKAIGAML